MSDATRTQTLDVMSDRGISGRGSRREGPNQDISKGKPHTWICDPQVLCQPPSLRTNPFLTAGAPQLLSTALIVYFSLQGEQSGGTER